MKATDCLPDARSVDATDQRVRAINYITCLYDYSRQNFLHAGSRNADRVA